MILIVYPAKEVDSMRKFYVLISLLVMGLFLTGCDSIESYKGTIEQVIQHKVESQDDKETSENVEFVEVTVSRVIDGDTFEIEGQHKVRLIGINTPESTNKQELYGKEASAFTKSQLEGKTVYLQKDVSEADRYGRLLRYVWLEKPTDPHNENEIRRKMFNAIIVQEGYAQPSTYPPDVAYSEYFVKFAREAREQGVGLWQYGKDGTTKGDDID